MPATTEQIKELRELTGAGIMECKRAIEEGGSLENAQKLLKEWGVATAAKKSDREANAGLIESYVHLGRIGALIELNCETDFVARTDDFKKLAREIAMHIASAAPLSVDKDGVPAAAVERERRIAEEQVRASGKPDHLVAKIVEGKL